MMKTPDELTRAELMTYLRDAIKREHGVEWKPKSYIWATWAKQLAYLIDHEVPPYLVALGLDLIALDWPRVAEESPWEILSPGSLLKPFRGVGWPVWLWRAVWWSRQAHSPDEVRYYQYWLIQAGLACDGTTLEAVTEARAALEVAEQRLRRRGARRQFRLHWLRDWRKTWS